MAIYPQAVYKPIKVNHSTAVYVKNCVLYHVAASEADSLYGWFSNPSARASSHFYIAYDGTVEQYIDTRYTSWANGDGNSRSVTIETAGQGTGKWTPAQLESLIRLTIWICKTHNITIREMTSSSVSQTGIGWHRLGIDGNFPSLPSILAGRGQRGGGQVWSSSRGKVCPGSDRILQIPAIIKAVKEGSTSQATPKPSVKPPVKPVDNPTKPVDKPVDKPKPKYGKTSGKLKTDGWLGKETVKDLQRYYQTPVDGILSGQYKSSHNKALKSVHWRQSKPTGSTVIRALQRDLGVSVDGLMGPATIRALQRRLKTPVDGVLSSPSIMVIALQRALNKGKI